MSGLIAVGALVVLAAVALLALGWAAGAANERSYQYLEQDSMRLRGELRLYDIAQDAAADMLATAREME